jgi:hypothetical protein
MIINGQKILMTWNPSNKKYYEKKGYQFTKYNDEFLIIVEDLSPGSNKDVEIECDYCNRPFPRPYYRHVSIRKNSKNQKDHCEKCNG